MNSDIPYMASVTNLHRILDSIQRAGAPEVFSLEFLKDLGFSSSNDRGAPKLLKYLGFLEDSGKPLQSYRDFMDHTRSKQILASRMRIAFDDLFTADKQANAKTAEQLKGWFKSKTGAGDAVAKKIASTFKSLASYADFSAPQEQIAKQEEIIPAPVDIAKSQEHAADDGNRKLTQLRNPQIGLVNRFEIHLPDTNNIDTYRAIFKALREELM